jgi:hypothetical protein
MASVPVRFVGHPRFTHAPYLPDMLACDYLAGVLAPLLGLRMDRARETVLHAVRCIDGGCVQTLNYSNRLRRLGDLLSPAGRLLVLPVGLPLLRGNATRSDIRDGCSVCLAPSGTNFALDCYHRFHDGCLARWTARTCPLCRAPFSLRDRAALQLSLVDGVREGRLDMSALCHNNNNKSDGP